MKKKHVSQKTDMSGKIDLYMRKHMTFNSLIHASAGIGLGILLTNGIFNPHPIRWAVFFILLSVAGHVWAYSKFKKG